MTLIKLQDSTKLKKELVNDVYGQYEAVFPGDEEHGVHSLKANVILPGKVDSRLVSLDLKRQLG